MVDIIKKLDEAFEQAENSSIEELAKEIDPVHLKRLTTWKFGHYGWTSPVNLMITSAWYKWLNPEQDVCKIWSTDHAKKKILGGFAIRSVDEKYTVPLVTKNRIAGSFCSPNSGMQGSRAIEKMRGQGRIDRDTAIEQAVSFDMHLFQNIMNDIDDCSEDAAFRYLAFLLRLGIERRNERDEKLLKLADKTDFAVLRADDLIDFCNECGDPQLVKLLVAVLLVPLVGNFMTEFSVEGIVGSKTAADAQSKSPGDFWFIEKGTGSLVGVEVKDKTKTIGFDILHAIENRQKNNPLMRNYIAVTAATVSVSEAVSRDPMWHAGIKRLRNQNNLNVLCLSIYELAALRNLIGLDGGKLIQEMNAFLLDAIDLKHDTIEKWQAYILKYEKK